MNTSQHCRLGLFQDSEFSGDFDDSKINFRWCLVFFFEAKHFVPVSWMCKKPTSVSHSSTQSWVLSLAAGLCMDGLLALGLWDIVIEVLRSTNNKVQPKHTSHQGTGAVLDSKTKTHNVKRRQKVERLHEVDYVPTNTCRLGLIQPSFSTSGGILCIFGKLNIRSHKLDVPETNFSLSQFNRTEVISLDWFGHGWSSCS